MELINFLLLKGGAYLREGAYFRGGLIEDLRYHDFSHYLLTVWSWSYILQNPFSSCQYHVHSVARGLLELMSDSVDRRRSCDR